MKHLLLLLLLLPVFAHAQLSDDFSDGNFTANPAWTGDVASFQVTTQQLQSNGPAVTGTQLQLVTPSQATTGTTWEFWVNLRLATSSGNLADVWLMSEQADLKATGNRGYFVRLGGSNDEVSLFRKDATGNPVYVVDGADGTLPTTTTASTASITRVRVTRSPNNVWTLERDLAGGRTFVPEGTGTDATYQRSQYLGVLLLYSSANGRNFYFDDFAVTDNTPPQLSDVVVAGANQLDVLFNEPVAASTAATNFRLGNGVSPITAVRSATDAGLFRLTFAAALPTGANTLEARNVADLYGNVATGPLTLGFTTVAPTVAPGYHQLLISEIYANETAPAGSPPATYASEFIEIYNPTANVLDLTGVRLSRTSSTATAAVFPTGAVLQPGEYAVVCGSTRASQFAGSGKVFGLTNFPTLLNAGDQLLLRNRQGRAVFEVSYSDTWYPDATKRAGGWSLEMIDTGQPCADGQNWTASLDPTGATPGRRNSVAANNPDRTAPALLSATASSATTVRLTFGEKLDSTLMGNAALYTLQPAVAVQRATVLPYDFRTVELTLAASLPINQATTVAVQRATDCVGNGTGPVTSASFTYYGPPVAPRFNQLLITEIMADEDPPVGLPKAEFVEIFNPTATLLDLGGVRLLKPGASSAAVFPAGAVLRPGEYAVVCGTSAVTLFNQFFASTTNAPRVFGLTSFPALSNGSDQLLLRGRDGRVLFEVAYSDTWYRDANKKLGGWSLEMLDTSNPCAGASNWTASTNPLGGTPGKVNSVRAANADATAPTLLRALALDATTVRAYFSEKLDSAAAANPARYALAAPGPAVTRAAPVAPDFRQVDLTLAAALTPSRPTTLTVQTATDCVGNASGPLQSAALALPEAAASGDVVINELLFNPRSGSVRFVEVLNRSSKFLSLQGWQFIRGRVNGRATATPITTDPLVLAPGQLLAFTPDVANIQTQYPTSHDLANLFQVSSLPTFSDPDTVNLLNDRNQTIDRLAYSKALHLSLLASQEGVSLERIRAAGLSNGSNFHSAASAVGYATPGRPNSQAQDALGGDQEWTVLPEVFTPDDDGQQDFATLNYHLDQPGYAATVTVYDALGRLTRRLVRNETLPTTGFLQWDGIDDKGHKAAVGYYILLVELFRPSGGEKREFKKTVVLGARF
ncbi:lamin tail domain-containing protein [Hymenobacter monticola]|uniref:Lamin tail domain-containing protein n=1 Tax=Hymenobacter monticola TaxID=1705399 RepID=A0ABY4BBF8_9BACT|nr:lamin tail domain-containing protein [Hymenobacter monticola]UOE35011.1 lamin tail domain-containing protein [Hymenobacter monticola]